MRNAFVARGRELLKRPWILAWLTFAAFAAQAATEHRSLPAARDFARDGVEANSRGFPVLVLFSRPDCAWCERVRREHLLPMLARTPAETSALLRQVEVDGELPLRDFDGGQTTHKAFAARMNARLTPTLMFLGADGKPKAETIVGYRLADFYGAYIERALEEARAAMQKEAR